ncbi:TIGR03790 family protein [Methylophilus aquaticus]|uniref:TIGR03790 family protein n=1 Tax=Methylophilus aquaticus TaxID=1971610 RepID=A0ABT9JU79_9PROT|nr:TIGR03790 family protein [Methylophilus aquaticus]MDP8568034.1 TIGR03790 family protein [Methylophilus aquaticus]
MLFKKIKNLLFLCSLLVANVFLSALASDLDISRQIREHHSLLKPEDVAVIYNLGDSRSEEVARYYLQARQIPIENLIGVTLPKPGKEVLSVPEFESLKSQIDAKLGKQQVLLLVWRAPFAVQCNSLTSALSLGLDLDQCKNSCAPGRDNPYFNSASRRPWADHQIRLSMLLPVTTVDSARALIDRGVLSEFSLNDAQAFFLKTRDAARSKPREPFFPLDGATVKSKKLVCHTLMSEALERESAVMFYFTGQKRVPSLATNGYLPGAIADHLTSSGGVLRDTQDQMPVTQWLEAGVTGSYGTVSEPCNYWQKFPNPQVVMAHYLAGETLIEAYWKSVKWPMQGVFVGEPLAKPYARSMPMFAD